jgi:hypothetical protein
MTWYAGNNSTNGGNNTGWVFTDPPPILYARLYNSGVFSISNTIFFDEVSKTTATISKSGVYSSQFDEVSNPGVPMRIKNDGTIQVSGSFDEVTGIL